jgi:hypothetical protein
VRGWQQRVVARIAFGNFCARLRVLQNTRAGVVLLPDQGDVPVVCNQTQLLAWVDIRLIAEFFG